MSTEGLDHIGVTCTECEMAETANDPSALVRFNQKHTEHTGHTTTWALLTEENGHIITSEATETFTVTCETCEQDWEFTTEGEAETHADEHEEYTDHSADDVTKTTTYTATCLICDEVKEFDSADAAHEWRETHDHSTDLSSLEDLTHTDDIDAVDIDLRDIIEATTDAHSTGAPLPLVILKAARHGLSSTRTQEEIETLRRQGEVYEPARGFLCVT
jgi:hypothetical protein